MSLRISSSKLTDTCMYHISDQTSGLGKSNLWNGHACKLHCCAMTLSTSTLLFIFVIVCMYQVQTLYPTKYHEVPHDIIGKASPDFKTVTIIIDLVSSFCYCYCCYCYSCIVEQWVCLARHPRAITRLPLSGRNRHNDPQC